MKPAVVILALIIPSTLAAETASSQRVNLNQDLRTLARIIGVSKELNRQRSVLKAILDENIEQLREPRPDGTYRWAFLQREEDGRVTEERGVEKVSTESQLATIFVAAPRAYRLIVSAPVKRNLFSANHRVFVRDAVIESTGFDGRTSRTEVPVNVWINPGESHGVALPEIGKSVQAKVSVGVDTGNKKAVATVALLQAKLVDDPASPAYPAVRRLLDLRRRVSEDEIRRTDLANAIDESLLSLPGEMEKRHAEMAQRQTERVTLFDRGALRDSISSGDATPDVVAAIEEIARLSSGTLDQQSLARVRLQELVERLKPSAGSMAAQ